MKETKERDLLHYRKLKADSQVFANQFDLNYTPKFSNENKEYNEMN